MGHCFCYEEEGRIRSTVSNREQLQTEKHYSRHHSPSTFLFAIKVSLLRGTTDNKWATVSVLRRKAEYAAKFLTENGYRQKKTKHHSPSTFLFAIKVLLLRKATDNKWATASVMRRKAEYAAQFLTENRHQDRKVRNKILSPFGRLCAYHPMDYRTILYVYAFLSQQKPQLGSHTPTSNILCAAVASSLYYNI
jgi:hypothetical protein